MDSSTIVTIAVAIIGSIEVIIVAVISNWDKLTKGRRNRAPAASPVAAARSGRKKAASTPEDTPVRPARRRIVLLVSCAYLVFILSQIIGDGRAFVYANPYPSGSFVEASDIDNFAWGLIGTRLIADCDNGIDAIEFSQRRWDRLAELLTFGFWKPVSVRYICRPVPPPSLDG